MCSLFSKRCRLVSKYSACSDRRSEMRYLYKMQLLTIYLRVCVLLSQHLLFCWTKLLYFEWKSYNTIHNKVNLYFFFLNFLTAQCLFRKESKQVLSSHQWSNFSKTVTYLIFTAALQEQRAGGLGDHLDAKCPQGLSGKWPN